jgi:hypothetical protein
MALAIREAAGFGAAFLLLAWQDAGLNLLRLGSQRWMGVGLSLLGGYLLVTALSAPQQKPIAELFGGKVPRSQPPPPKRSREIQLDAVPVTSGPVQEETHIPILPSWLRVVFAVAALLILIGAALLVLNMSIPLLRHPVQPFIPSIEDLILE